MDTTQAQNRVLTSKTSNVAKPVKGYIDPTTGLPLAQNYVEFTIGTDPDVSGGGDFFLNMATKQFTSTIAGGLDISDVAAAIVGDWQTGIDAQFGAGNFEVTNPNAPSAVIRVQSTDETPLDIQNIGTSDANLTISPSAGSFGDTAILYGSQTQGDGAPTIYTSGFATIAKAKDADGAVNVMVDVKLPNFSGGDVTARWRLWWWVDYVGWVVDQEVGVRSLTAVNNSIGDDAIVVSGLGATRIAVELVDDGAAGALPAGASVTARATVLN